MASSVARGLNPRLLSPRAAACPRCWRAFTWSASLRSGHNKWSKIKHDKAVADAKKTSVRSQFTKNLTLYSKLYGADPGSNPHLATVLAAAKKAGVPKALIEGAIARGQGRSGEGTTLETAVYEAIFPPSVAIVVEAETDNKNRVLQDLCLMVKKGGGITSASKFFFTRLGRVVFQKAGDGVGADTIMDEALEAGAEDLEEDEDGNVVVWTRPSQTMHVCRTISSSFGLKVLSSDIIWSPNEDTKVRLDSSPELPILTDLLAKMQEHPDVQAVYSNISRGAMSDDEWGKLQDNLSV